MKEKILAMLICVCMVGVILGGCGSKEDKTTYDVAPVIEEESDGEAIEEETDNVETETETSEESEAAEEEQEGLYDESILEEPIPDDLNEAKEILYSITDDELKYKYAGYVCAEVSCGDIDHPTQEQTARAKMWETILMEYMENEADIEFLQNTCDYRDELMSEKK